MKIEYIIVHYSATYSDQNITAADIDKMHKARGFKGIGYNYFIRRDGLLEQGRPEGTVGAHTLGYNDKSVGVCWAGGLERATGPNVGVDNRTPEQNETLINIINELLTRYPNAKVVGHRDLSATQCPGFNVQPWWKLVNTLNTDTDDEIEALLKEYTQKLLEIIRKKDV